MAWMLPSLRGAGVVPPSGLRFMFRELQGSKFNGSKPPTNGKPSVTRSFESFQLPTFALMWRNSSGVMLPSRSAWSPYWTPTLSQGTRANPYSSVP